MSQQPESEDKKRPNYEEGLESDGTSTLDTINALIVEGAAIQRRS
jgi:hypothetical protein